MIHFAGRLMLADCASRETARTGRYALASGSGVLGRRNQLSGGQKFSFESFSNLWRKQVSFCLRILQRLELCYIWAMSNATENESEKPQRPWLFKKGQAGGPGRPKRVLTAEELFEREVKNDLRNAAKTFSAEALQTLAGIMRDTSAQPQHRIAAANALLDRGHGKPHRETTVTVDHYARLSDADLIRLISGKDVSDEEINAVRGPLMLEGTIDGE